MFDNIEDTLTVERLQVFDFESMRAYPALLEAERPDLGRPVSLPARPESAPSGELPTVDQIADAAIRATERAAGPGRGIPLNQGASQALETHQPSGTIGDRPEAQHATTPEQTGPIGASGPLHPVLEGTIIDTVLTNRVDGAGPAPVNCLVTNRTVVITGSLGESASQSTSQVMNKFLNRLPTVTIREGHRVKVYFTSDFALPAYPMPGHAEPF